MNVILILLSLLGLVLTSLKLANVVNWMWGMVLTPFYIVAGFQILECAINIKKKHPVHKMRGQYVVLIREAAYDFGYAYLPASPWMIYSKCGKNKKLALKKWEEELPYNEDLFERCIEDLTEKEIIEWTKGKDFKDWHSDIFKQEWKN